jgi:hypothetical protein
MKKLMIFVADVDYGILQQLGLRHDAQPETIAEDLIALCCDNVRERQHVIPSAIDLAASR